MRTTNIPSQTVTEDICNLEEIPGLQVRFLVGNKDSNGNYILGQQLQTFVITGADYTELNGPPTTWATDKPNGTYRNSDL